MKQDEYLIQGSSCFINNAQVAGPGESQWSPVVGDASDRDLNSSHLWVHVHYHAELTCD